MNGLWTGAAKAPGGELKFDDGAESFVFVPLEVLVEHFDDRDDGMIILNQHPDYFSWTMFNTRDEAIYSATKLDGKKPPKKIAASLVEYLEQLGSRYGDR